MDVSFELLGVLGGASRQAVWKSGSPLFWLQSRIRRALVPDEHPLLHRVGAIPQRARVNAEAFLQEALERLEAVPARSRLGRRRKDSPAALALLLGVSFRDGDGLFRILERYVARCLRELVLYYRGLPKGERWYKLRRRLDGWLPRWANRVTGRAPSTWQLAVAALNEYG